MASDTNTSLSHLLRTYLVRSDFSSNIFQASQAHQVPSDTYKWGTMTAIVHTSLTQPGQDNS